MQALEAYAHNYLWWADSRMKTEIRIDKTRIAKAAILLRIGTGIIMLVFGLGLLNFVPTTGAVLVAAQWVRGFYALYAISFIVSGVMMTLFKMRFLMFAGYLSPMWLYFALSIYALAIGKISLFGLTLFLALIGCFILTVWVVLDEF